MILRNKVLIASGLFISLLTVGCKHKPVVNGDPTVDDSCDPNLVYFTNTIQPLLLSNCGFSGCHDAITHQEGLNVTTYESLMNGDFVVPGDPGESELYDVIVDGEMPQSPYPHLSSEEAQLIYNWIQQGALNNTCAQCDTNSFAFQADIWPIINLSCVGCHSGSTPSGDVLLTNYTQIKAQVDLGAIPGVLYGDIYPLMPFGTGLNSCDKTKIIKWVNDGAQDN